MWMTFLCGYLDAISEPLLHGLLELWGQEVLVGRWAAVGTWGWSGLDGQQLLGQLQHNKAL